MSRFCSIWDLSKELQNIARGDILRPQNPEKGSRWLEQQLNQLPQELKCQAQVRAYRLTHLQYRAVWLEMANHHLEVIEILWSATDDPRKFHCLFNHAMKKMQDFLETFATKVAPLSSQLLDPQFKILMENFGTVVDTISIFYDCFDCENRSETLRNERNAGRMHFFRFEKNDPRPPLDARAGKKLYDAQYPKTTTPNTKEAHSSPQAEIPESPPTQDLDFTPLSTNDPYWASFDYDWTYQSQYEMGYYYWPGDEMMVRILRNFPWTPKQLHSVD